MTIENVNFDYRLYTAPFALVGKVLWLRATDGAVALFDDFRHIATHCKALKPSEHRSVRDASGAEGGPHHR